jgi:hypothetical protein
VSLGGTAAKKRLTPSGDSVTVVDEVSETQTSLAATKVIRVDPEVAARLAQEAQGFESRNDVLRRLLGLDKPKAA